MKKTAPMDNAAVAQKVDQLISENTVMVFSKSYCPFCKKAIQALEKLNPKGMKIYQIENEPDMTEIQNYLKKKTGGSSVPRVFIKSQFIGGGDETARAYVDGSLKAKLMEAGAI